MEAATGGTQGSPNKRIDIPPTRLICDIAGRCPDVTLRSSYSDPRFSFPLDTAIEPRAPRPACRLKLPPSPRWQPWWRQTIRADDSAHLHVNHHRRADLRAV